MGLLIKHKKHQFAACPTCGRPMHGSRLRRGHLCGRCEKRLMAKSPYRENASSELATCRICGKKFHVLPYQDPKYTWYCPDCRARIAPISTGINWIQNMGGDPATLSGDKEPAQEQDPHQEEVDRLVAEVEQDDKPPVGEMKLLKAIGIKEEE